MLIPISLFIVGLIFLIKGGGWFVDGATGIAHRFKVPELLIGATVVSCGTTLPEVMVSATSALSGHGEIAYGNAIGSIICNTALIAAITIAIKPSKVDRKSLKAPVIFFFIAAGFYVAVAFIAGSFSRMTGIILLAIFVVYMIYSVVQAREKPEASSAETSAILSSDISDKKVEDASESDEKEEPVWKDIALLVVGAALIAVGADLLVDNGTLIAEALGVPESVIALTFVALGTSLPELVTAITSLVKGHGALSLGNIVGANLFNLVFVSGVATVLAPFTLPQGKMVAGINASLVIDIPIMLFVMMFMTIPALVRGKLSRFQGILLLLIYAAFCAFQFLS